VGFGPSIVYSLNDGDTWLEGTPPAGFTQGLYAVAHHSGTWIAVGDGGTVIQSLNNGATWTLLEDTGVVSTNRFVSIETDGTTWVVGSRWGHIYTTTDLDNWSDYDTGDTGHVWGVATDGAGNWVATIAGYGPVYSSNPASSWTQGFGGFADVRDVATDGNGTWICVGWNGTDFGSNNTMVSTDNGQIWAVAGDVNVYIPECIVTDGNGVWIAGGGADATHPDEVSYSLDDGATWTGRSNVVASNIRGPAAK
jgi:hypothetical protein